MRIPTNFIPCSVVLFAAIMNNGCEATCPAADTCDAISTPLAPTAAPTPAPPPGWVTLDYEMVWGSSTGTCTTGRWHTIGQGYSWDQCLAACKASTRYGDGVTTGCVFRANGWCRQAGDGCWSLSQCTHTACGGKSAYTCAAQAGCAAADQTRPCVDVAPPLVEYALSKNPYVGKNSAQSDADHSRSDSEDYIFFLQAGDYHESVYNRASNAINDECCVTAGRSFRANSAGVADPAENALCLRLTDGNEEIVGSVDFYLSILPSTERPGSWYGVFLSNSCTKASKNPRPLYCKNLAFDQCTLPIFSCVPASLFSSFFFSTFSLVLNWWTSTQSLTIVSCWFRAGVLTLTFYVHITSTGKLQQRLSVQ